MNQIVIKGNLGANPEVKTVGKNNNSICTFNLAVNEYRGKDQNGAPRYETFWVRIVAWGRLAEALSSLEKGDQVVVSGKLSIRSYEDQGQKRYATEIVADEVSKVQRLKRQASEDTDSEPLFDDED